MQPDPQTIPTPIPKTDPPSLRKPLRLALLRAVGLALDASRPPRTVGRAPAQVRSEGGAAYTGQNLPTDSQPQAGRPPGPVGARGDTGDRQNDPPRILLIRPDHLGDMLFVTPALTLLRAQLPEAHLTALVGPWAKPVLANNPQLDALQTLDFPGFTRSAKASPLAPYHYLWAAARQLRAQRFDTAVILRFDHWWGALLAALAGIPRRIGYDVPEVRPFINDVLHYEPGRHEVLQNIRLAARAAYALEPAPTKAATLSLEFRPTPEAEAFADTWLRSKGITAGERFALLLPGSGASVKLWRADGFARVAEALHARGLKTVIAGAGEAERLLAESIAAQAAAPMVNAAGETTLDQLAALCARAALAVGTDNGPMHLAVAMGTPSVHLFGPVSAQTFGPWGGRSLSTYVDHMHGSRAQDEPGSFDTPVARPSAGGDTSAGTAHAENPADPARPPGGARSALDAGKDSAGRPADASPVRANANVPGYGSGHIVLTSGLACIACNRLDYTSAELPAHPCVPLIAERQVVAAIAALTPVL